MIIFEKFQQVKEMNIQLVDYNYFKEHYKMITIDLTTRT